MRLLSCDLEENQFQDTGSIIFEMEDENGVAYVYYIGETDGPPGWFSRQLATDYYGGGNSWESAEWHPETQKRFPFKFLSKKI